MCYYEYMTFEVINNPIFSQASGFTSAQFKKLDQLYCMAASDGSLTYRTVDCNFDDGVATYTYYKSEYQSPYLQFIIRQVGPCSTMFELFKQGKGLIVKSGIFDRTYDRLAKEIKGCLSL